MKCSRYEALLFIVTWFLGKQISQKIFDAILKKNKEICLKYLIDAPLDV
jgi:hypothetical protein